MKKGRGNERMKKDGKKDFLMHSNEAAAFGTC